MMKSIFNADKQTTNSYGNHEKIREKESQLYNQYTDEIYLKLV